MNIQQLPGADPGDDFTIPSGSEFLLQALIRAIGLMTRLPEIPNENPPLPCGLMIGKPISLEYDDPVYPIILYSLTEGDDGDGYCVGYLPMQDLDDDEEALIEKVVEDIHALYKQATSADVEWGWDDATDNE